MPAPPDLHQRLLRPLNETGIPYMVTGGLAAIVYGEPRLTNDVDIVLGIEPYDAERFLDAFPSTEYYVPPVETIREEAARPAHGHFNVLELERALRADIYCLGRDPLGRWAMDRRKSVAIGDESIWLAPIEYVIAQKLRYHRKSGSERHLRDVAAMLRISEDLIDRAALDMWLDDLHLRAEWDQARRVTGV
ncbi:MAG: hypothetical protein ACREOG_20835 [Gemmatimonadaceae bacterium]